MLRILIAVGGIQIVAILIGLIRTKLIALLLGPQGVGVVSVVDQVVQLVAYISAFSLPVASIRFLSKAHSESEARFRQVYAAFLKAIVTLAGTGMIVGAVIVLIQPQWLGEDIARYGNYVAIAVLALPAMLVGGFIPSVLAAAQKVRTSAGMAVISNAGMAIGCTAGILAAGITGMYVGSVLVTTLIGIGGLLYLRAKLHLPAFDAHASVVSEMKANREIVFVAAMYALGAVAMSAALLVTRQAVLSSGGETSAGLLQSAYGLALAIGLVLNPTNGLYLTPILNRNLEPSIKIATALDYQSRLAALLLLAAAPMVLFPKTCLLILFSDRFVEAAQWLYLFVLAQMMLQIAGVYHAILIGLDELRAFAATNVGGHFVTGASALLLVPRMGIMGAGIAMLAGATVAALTSFLWLRLRHEFGRSFRRFAPVLYALVAVGACGFFVRSIPEWNPAAFAARLLLATALVLGATPFLASELKHDFLGGVFGRIAGRKHDRRTELGD